MKYEDGGRGSLFQVLVASAELMVAGWGFEHHLKVVKIVVNSERICFFVRGNLRKPALSQVFVCSP